MNGRIGSTFVNGFDLTESEAWIPDTLRSLRSLTRSGMTDSILRLGKSLTLEIGYAGNEVRHSRPWSECEARAESVGNPCLGLYEARAGEKNRSQEVNPK